MLRKNNKRRQVGKQTNQSVPLRLSKAAVLKADKWWNRYPAECNVCSNLAQVREEVSLSDCARNGTPGRQNGAPNDGPVGELFAG